MASLSFMSAAVLAAVLTLACAALTYYAVEMPIRNWAARRINGRSTAPAADVPGRSDVVAPLDAPSDVAVSRASDRPGGMVFNGCMAATGNTNTEFELRGFNHIAWSAGTWPRRSRGTRTSSA